MGRPLWEICLAPDRHLGDRCCPRAAAAIHRRRLSGLDKAPYAAPMQGVPLLDELMANAWRPAVVETYGGWRYRWAEGVTRRANSALALGTGGSIEELVARAEAFYGKRGAPTLIQVSTASAPPSLATYLHERGYRSTARTLVEAAATREVLARTGPSAYEIEVTEAPTDEWFNTYWSVEATRGRNDMDKAVCRSVLLPSGMPSAFATALHGSEVLGVAQLVIERGWGGVQCMATDSSHRRRGVAKAVLCGLAEQAFRHEVEHMYLAVMADNDAAASLYERSGFEVVHEYSYFAGQTD
jgi:N-acetylglutamate synthase